MAPTPNAGHNRDVEFEGELFNFPRGVTGEMEAQPIDTDNNSPAALIVTEYDPHNRDGERSVTNSTNDRLKESGDHTTKSPADKLSLCSFKRKTDGKGLQQQHQQLRDLWNRFIWHGGSVTDAWLTSCSGQVGQVLLTLPTSYAQMGYGFAITFQLLYASVGCWTSYLLANLYQEYRHRREREGVDFSNHIIQYHEMMGHLAGKWARIFSLIFNILAIGAVSLSQLTACASTLHIFNPDLNKREWTFIMGSGMLITFLVPTIHNYRIMSFVALATATYTSWYMAIAALMHGQVGKVNHTGAADLQFFTGTTNVLFAFSAHTVSVETIHAMWQPKKYNQVFMFTSAYVLTITMPHSLAMYWAFGDLLLDHNNALSVLPDSTFRSIAIVAMIIHQAIVCGLFSLPLNLMWEKMLGVHQAHYLVRICCARLPVGLFIWFLAIAFPFFGPTNSLIGSLVVSFSAAIIPCAVHVYTFRTPAARENAATKPTKWLPGWDGTVAVNLTTIFLIAVLGVGLGGWASISTFVHKINNEGVFSKCYQCNNTVATFN